ncbi:hypothetical protein QBC46DRAFT_405917 [Diplogelasinospora grovesii]|uniref:Uncharacterized protein n=1 Tax=Diplogelasinospora grovesii TaxID=303347 RepID=A0AAN6ND43_9PEZI|nr:hypothetical protein QBC46DRAFT_405917 [Diplogelasinospora grovesii]
MSPKITVQERKAAAESRIEPGFALEKVHGGEDHFRQVFYKSVQQSPALAEASPPPMPPKETTFHQNLHLPYERAYFLRELLESNTPQARHQTKNIQWLIHHYETGGSIPDPHSPIWLLDGVRQSTGKKPTDVPAGSALWKEEACSPDTLHTSGSLTKPKLKFGPPRSSGTSPTMPKRGGSTSRSQSNSRPRQIEAPLRPGVVCKEFWKKIFRAIRKEGRDPETEDLWPIWVTLKEEIRRRGIS